ncbi:MAG: FtsW/RodA/SpoVE family cell cycle protein [Gemella haemolysans]|uniref:FtsW/RodA/SpoVE family cell cycle protein n=1 Tax=Gemella haemolysans TaxID=1379 RepID=UPI0029123FD9|nr:FtsW/RodA/SpoVE family cell cycle protein [Gemella haemolysans]MDU6572964.1 FtsW/RodA/SpoVE family cell cycle protein [Gemella haemolysans]
MLNFIKNKTNLSILIFYFIFSFSSLLFILLAEYNNNKTPTLFLKQFIFYLIGFGIIYLLQKIPINYIEKFSIAFYLFALVLLVGIFLVPPTLAPIVNGARSWYNFRLFTLQPSEFGKIATVAMVSMLIKEKSFKDNTDTIKLLKLAFIISIPFILVAKENDLGNGLFFIFLFLGLVFLVCNKGKTLFRIYSVVIAGLAIIILAALYFPRLLSLVGLKSYQLNRILSWLNPEAYKLDYSYQITQVLNEVKLGGLTGTFVKNKNYIDEQFNDFIFSIVAKNFGFIGAAIFLFIFFIFILRLFNIVKKCEQGNYSYYFILLSICSFCFSFFINIFSTLSIIPVIGISMPFISYGGSSLIANSILFGIIVKIHATIQEEYMEDEYYDNYEEEYDEIQYEDDYDPLEPVYENNNNRYFEEEPQQFRRSKRKR